MGELAATIVANSASARVHEERISVLEAQRRLAVSTATTATTPPTSEAILALISAEVARVVRPVMSELQALRNGLYKANTMVVELQAKRRKVEVVMQLQVKNLEGKTV
eukprot:2794244-Heterocapsa_arctica.AAC.1